METVNTNDLMFFITKNELQYEAQERIGRFLTEKEIRIAKKGFEWGFLNGIDTIVDVIFEMIQENKVK